ncbi:MAG: ExbD/TolR family protein [bacterium]
MTKGGIIIRLIDVAMIILFGFIVISDIKVRAQIKLPSDEQQSETKITEQKLILVQVGLEGDYVIKENEDVVAETSDLHVLEEKLAKLFHDYRSAGTDMIVLIEPDQDSIIQRTIDVLDICERNQIPKNIKY